MSFEVRSFSPVDENWEERDEIIYKAAGRKSDTSGSGCPHGQEIGERDHLWKVKEWKDAQDLLQRLKLVEGVRACLKEATTISKRGKK